MGIKELYGFFLIHTASRTPCDHNNHVMLRNDKYILSTKSHCGIDEFFPCAFWVWR